MQPNTTKPQANRLFRSVYEPYLSKVNYTIHMALSAVVVLLCRLLAHQPILLFSHAVIIGIAIYLINNVFTRVQLSPSTRYYTGYAVPLLFALHYASTLTGIYLSNPATVYTPTQHSAVHFALCFYTLSTLEHYITPSNTDISLPNETSLSTARGPRGYWTYTPILLLPKVPLQEEEDSWCVTFMLHPVVLAHMLQLVVFHTVTGLLNHVLRRLVNPAAVYPDTVLTDFCWPGECVDVNWFLDNTLGAVGMNTHLFDETSVWVFMVNYYFFSRVVRETHFVVFWGLVDGLVGLGRWWRGGGGEERSKSDVCGGGDADGEEDRWEEDRDTVDEKSRLLGDYSGLPSCGV
ncbi:hypothetical protein PTMSG1_00331 [Pyrenophora teres f. maculata]|nr:hypothetical protein PTMSG1_00331 [Pyrenophora teres f. maculata]